MLQRIESTYQCYAVLARSTVEVRTLDMSNRSLQEIANETASNSSNSSYRFLSLLNHSIATTQLSHPRLNHDGTGFRYLFLKKSMSDAVQYETRHDEMRHNKIR
jgi:hypothetical protein